MARERLLSVLCRREVWPLWKQQRKASLWRAWKLAANGAGSQQEAGREPRKAGDFKLSDNQQWAMVQGGQGRGALKSSHWVAVRRSLLVWKIPSRWSHFQGTQEVYIFRPPCSFVRAVWLIADQWDVGGSDVCLVIKHPAQFWTVTLSLLACEMQRIQHRTSREL